MTSPASVLGDAFARHTWSTLRLLDHLAGLDPTSYEAGIPGTYGSIPETLTHLVDADDRYLARMDDPDPVRPAPQPFDIGTLRARVQANDATWHGVLDRLEAGILRARVAPRGEDDPGFDPAETLLLLQALHHGDDHRAQVCSTLGALGLEVPDLDVWSFWDAERRSR